MGNVSSFMFSSIKQVLCDDLSTTFSSNLNLSTSDDHIWATFLASVSSEPICHHVHQHAFSHQLAASVLVSARDNIHAPQSSGSSRSWPSSISVSWNRTFHTVLVVVVLVDLVATLALDRHCSATMFAVFLCRVTAVLNSVLLC